MNDGPKDEERPDNLDVIRQLLRKLEEVAAADDGSETTGKPSRVSPATTDTALPASPPSQEPPSQEIVVGETPGQSPRALTASVEPAPATEVANRELTERAEAGEQRSLTTLKRSGPSAPMSLPPPPNALPSRTRLQPVAVEKTVPSPGRRSPTVAIMSFALGALTAAVLVVFMDPIRRTLTDVGGSGSVVVGQMPADPQSSSSQSSKTNGQPPRPAASEPAAGPAHTDAAAAPVSEPGVRAGTAATAGAAAVVPSGQVVAAGHDLVVAGHDKPAAALAASAPPPADKETPTAATSAAAPDTKVNTSADTTADTTAGSAAAPSAPRQQHDAQAPASPTSHRDQPPTKHAAYDARSSVPSAAHPSGKAEASKSEAGTAQNSKPESSDPDRRASATDATSRPAASVPAPPIAANADGATAGATSIAAADPAATSGAGPALQAPVPKPATRPQSTPPGMAVDGSVVPAISVPATVAIAGQRSALGLTLTLPPADQDQLLIIFRDVPFSVTLSKGSAIGNGIWLLPATQAHDIELIAAEGEAVSAGLTIEVATLLGKVLARATTQVVARPLTPPAQSGQDAAGTAISDPVRLIARARLLIDTAAIEEARTLLQRAAEGGSGVAAFELGRSYDPAEADRLGIARSASDEQLALTWYERARTLGSVEAAARLAARSGR